MIRKKLQLPVAILSVSLVLFLVFAGYVHGFTLITRVIR
jgi:hypothetical protein